MSAAVASDGNLAGYTLLERLAKGGMAEVFRARPPADESRGSDDPETVIVKRLLPEFRAEEGYVQLFLDEGKLCVRLNHPNIVRTFKVFKKSADYFMIQEFVDGASFSRVLQAAQERGKPMELAASVHVAQSVLKALEYLHAARRSEDGTGTVVHRDINPANILCSKTGTVKLTDFGVAEAEGQSMIGATGGVKGTLGYLAPESVLGRAVDRRADLYGVGIVLWEAVANQPLFAGESELEIMHKIRASRAPVLSKVRNDAPELLVQIVRKALFADPQLRFQTAGEFQKALSVLVVRAGLGRGEQVLAKEVQGGTQAAAAQPRA